MLKRKHSRMRVVRNIDAHGQFWYHFMHVWNDYLKPRGSMDLYGFGSSSFELLRERVETSYDSCWLSDEIYQVLTDALNEDVVKWEDFNIPENIKMDRYIEIRWYCNSNGQWWREGMYRKIPKVEDAVV